MMNDNKIIAAFQKEYGKDAKFEEGETQVFSFLDATVIITLENGTLNAIVTMDKPIQCEGKFFE